MLEQRSSELLEYIIWLESCDADASKIRLANETYKTNLEMLKAVKGE